MMYISRELNSKAEQGFKSSPSDMGRRHPSVLNCNTKCLLMNGRLFNMCYHVIFLEYFGNNVSFNFDTMKENENMKYLRCRKSLSIFNKSVNSGYFRIKEQWFLFLPMIFYIFYSLYKKFIQTVKPKKNYREETKLTQTSSHFFFSIHYCSIVLFTISVIQMFMLNSHHGKMKCVCANLFSFMCCNLIGLWSSCKLLHNDGFFQMRILGFPKSNPYLITFVTVSPNVYSCYHCVLTCHQSVDSKETLHLFLYCFLRIDSPPTHSFFFNIQTNAIFWVFIFFLSE